MSSGFGLFADGRGIVPLPQGRNGIVCRIWRRYKKNPWNRPAYRDFSDLCILINHTT